MIIFFFEKFRVWPRTLRLAYKQKSYLLIAETLTDKERYMNFTDEEDTAFEAKQNSSPELLNFGLKMFKSND